MGGGDYDQGGGAGQWQIAQAAGRPLKAHIHGPVNWLVGSCSWIAHDPGCAGLGPEKGCFPIQMGKNKGKYVCIH